MRIRTLVVVALLALSIVAGIFLWLSIREFAPLRVVFLDVGQGDAILITEGDTQVLIDGGAESRQLLGQLGRFVPFWDHRIETVIATHPDADHIGGLAAVIQRYRVGHFLSNGAEGQSGAAADLRQSLEQSSETDRAVLGSGSRLVFPGGAELSVLFPAGGAAADLEETNEGSIVARLEYGQASFLLTGDLPHEEAVLPDIEPAQVLKVAHHGSKYSTSDAWLARVRPEVAVVSVGKNRYGHPADEVLLRLRAVGTEVLRTDEIGNIVFVCQQNACVRERR